MAGWRETKSLKPIDKAIFGMVSESPGRNGSECTGSLESAKHRRLSPCPWGEDRMDGCSLTEAAGHSGGVVATAR
jgi:hypothetical protein